MRTEVGLWGVGAKGMFAVPRGVWMVSLEFTSRE